MKEAYYNGGIGVVVTQSGNVYFEESFKEIHQNIITRNQAFDPELKDDKEPPDQTFARVIFFPEDGYLKLSGDGYGRYDSYATQPYWWDGENGYYAELVKNAYEHSNAASVLAEEGLIM